jgi:hypothetical protein
MIHPEVTVDIRPVTLKRVRFNPHLTKGHLLGQKGASSTQGPRRLTRLVQPLIKGEHFLCPSRTTVDDLGALPLAVCALWKRLPRLVPAPVGGRYRSSGDRPSGNMQRLTIKREPGRQIADSTNEGPLGGYLQSSRLLSAHRDLMKIHGRGCISTRCGVRNDVDQREEREGQTERVLHASDEWLH